MTFAEENVAKPKVQLGVYYFDGWSGKTDSRHLTDRLKGEFSNREPVWGWHDNTPAIMEQQIDLAADAGISFWSFCWYWPEHGDKACPMHNAMTLYLHAANRKRLGFCLMVANHEGYRIGPRDWPEVCRAWIKLMQEPGYVTVAGKPLLIIFAPTGLIKEFGGAEPTREALDRFRAEAKAAGLPGVTVAGCCYPDHNLNEIAAAGFDVATAYNYPYANTKGQEKQQKFADLMEGHRRFWDEFAARSPIPYMPVVTAGWDMRPWEAPTLAKDKLSFYYPDRSPQAVGDFIADAVEWVDRHPEKTPRERIVMVYAWNEYGEGSYLCPTKPDGNAYLDAVRRGLTK